MTANEQYMNKREQSYMFAYNIVPAFLFRSDFAKLIALAHPQGFSYFQKYWEHLAKLFPSEHVVSNEQLATQAYQLAEGIYCLVVTMPPAERYLEVEYLGIVFQPKVRYLVAGRSDLPGTGLRKWTIREVTPSRHGPSGMLWKPDSASFAEEIARTLDLTPAVRIANDEEMKKHAESIETFPAEFQTTSPDAILPIAAAYKAISLKMGDTSGMSPAQVIQICTESGDALRKTIKEILLDAQQKAR